jgi:hypothetical protein
MFGLEVYKDVLGVPGEGFHQKRFMGLAAMDLLGVLIVAVLVGLLYGSAVVGVGAFFGVWAVGVLMHILFGVRTPVSAPFLKPESPSTK